MVCRQIAGCSRQGEQLRRLLRTRLAGDKTRTRTCNRGGYSRHRLEVQLVLRTDRATPSSPRRRQATGAAALFPQRAGSVARHKSRRKTHETGPPRQRRVPGQRRCAAPTSRRRWCSSRPTSATRSPRSRRASRRNPTSSMGHLLRGLALVTASERQLQRRGGALADAAAQASRANRRERGLMRATATDRRRSGCRLSRRSTACWSNIRATRSRCRPRTSWTSSAATRSTCATASARVLPALGRHACPATRTCSACTPSASRR